MEPNLHETYHLQLVADVKTSISTQATSTSLQHSQLSQYSQQSQSQSSSKTNQTLEEINIQEPLMLTHMVIEDYYVIEDQHTQNIIHYDDEWEFIEQRP